MALTIYKAGARPAVSTLNVLVYGVAGRGKTSLAYTFKRPLILDLDSGAHRAFAVPNTGTTLRIDQWDDIKELMQDHELLAEHDTIVVDTVGRALDYITAYIGRSNPKALTQAGNLSMNGWGELKSMFTAWMKQLNTLGKNVVLIAHDKEEKSGDDTAHRPDVQGGSYAEVLKVSDFVGFLWTDGTNNLLSFNPLGTGMNFFGKDSAQIGTVAVPHFSKVPTFGDDMITKMFTAFTTQAQRDTEIITAVNEWAEKISKAEDADDVTALQTMMREQITDGGVRLQVGRLLMMHAEHLGLKYDKETKSFSNPEPEPQPAVDPATEGGDGTVIETVNTETGEVITGEQGKLL